MRLFTLLLLLLPSLAVAADLVCTVPPAAIPRAQELCDELRIQMRVNSINWNNNQCATEMLRIGLLEAERRSTKMVVQDTVRNAVIDAVADLKADIPITAIRAFCGDSNVDVIGNYIEECDNGVNDGTTWRNGT